MKCPTCRKPAQKAVNKLFPFCCERCQLVDLGRWIGEEYRIPDENAPPPPDRGDDGE